MRYLIIHAWEGDDDLVGDVVTIQSAPPDIPPNSVYETCGLTPVWCVNVECSLDNGYHPREWLVPISDPDAEDRTTEETLTDELAA